MIDWFVDFMLVDMFEFMTYPSSGSNMGLNFQLSLSMSSNLSERLVRLSGDDYGFI